jgi:hypothetical protein
MYADFLYDPSMTATSCMHALVVWHTITSQLISTEILQTFVDVYIRLYLLIS